MGQFNFEIPDDLHKELKLYSIREEKDMRDILIELIREKIGGRRLVEEVDEDGS